MRVKEQKKEGRKKESREGEYPTQFIERETMAKWMTPDGISTILSNPSPNSSSELPEIFVQVVDLTPIGNRYKFTANDGKMKLKAMFPSSFSSEINSGNIQNLGFIQVFDYTLNDIPSKQEKYLIVTKCEAVSPALEVEFKAEVKSEESGIMLKPKQDEAKRGRAKQKKKRKKKRGEESGRRRTNWRGRVGGEKERKKKRKERRRRSMSQKTVSRKRGRKTKKEEEKRRRVRGGDFLEEEKKTQRVREERRCRSRRNSHGEDQGSRAER